MFSLSFDPSKTASISRSIGIYCNLLQFLFRSIPLPAAPTRFRSRILSQSGCRRPRATPTTLTPRPVPARYRSPGFLLGFSTCLAITVIKWLGAPLRIYLYDHWLLLPRVFTLAGGRVHMWRWWEEDKRIGGLFFESAFGMPNQS